MGDGGLLTEADQCSGLVGIARSVIFVDREKTANAYGAQYPNYDEDNDQFGQRKATMWDGADLGHRVGGRACAAALPRRLAASADVTSRDGDIRRIGALAFGNTDEAVCSVGRIYNARRNKCHLVGSGCRRGAICRRCGTWDNPHIIGCIQPCHRGNRAAIGTGNRWIPVRRHCDLRSFQNHRIRTVDQPTAVNQCRRRCQGAACSIHARNACVPASIKESRQRSGGEDAEDDDYDDQFDEGETCLLCSCHALCFFHLNTPIGESISSQSA